MIPIAAAVTPTGLTAAAMRPPTLRERIESLWLRMFMDEECALRYNSALVADMLRRELDEAA